MKSSILLVLATVALVMPELQAQTPAAKVDIKAPKFDPIPTPQFQAGNVPDKNWRPKTWLQIDMEFDIKVPPAAGGRNGSLASMTVNYYLAMSTTTKDGKRNVLKGSFEYVDIPASEKCHALAFVSLLIAEALGCDLCTRPRLARTPLPMPRAEARQLGRRRHACGATS